jgi:hypothetical protein
MRNDVRFALPNPYVPVCAAARPCRCPTGVRGAETKDRQMNSRTSNPRDIADQARRLTASRARRVERTTDPRAPPPIGQVHTVRLVIGAALVSAVSLVVVTTWHDDAARGVAARATAQQARTAPQVNATPQAHAAPQAGTAPSRTVIDHGAITPDAPSAGDAETVEASIAAYER